MVAVLMLVSLLSVLAVGVLESARSHSQLAQRSVEAIQMQEAADSALRVRLLELSEPKLGTAPAQSVGVQSANALGVAITLNVEMEAGRVDLNFADRDLLMSIFAGNNFSPEDAAALAERIVDWRDPDDQRSGQGAERPEYQSVGRHDGPRNRPFESISEVRRVMGMEKVPTDLLNAFTVYSHLANVRESAAPPVVTRALQWADKKQLGGRQWLGPESRMPQQSSPGRSLAGELLRLTACVGGPGQHLCRMAIVRLTGDAGRPLLIFRWDTAESERQLSADTSSS